jgi:hypothetical protein
VLIFVTASPKGTGSSKKKRNTVSTPTKKRTTASTPTKKRNTASTPTKKSKAAVGPREDKDDESPAYSGNDDDSESSADGGDDSENNSSPMESCLNCVRDEHECDGVKPTCGRCAEYGADCTWPGKFLLTTTLLVAKY